MSGARRPAILAAALVALLASGTRVAAADTPSNTPTPDFTTPAPAPVAAVDVEEKLGQTIPLDLAFRDQDGAPVTLRDLVRGDLPVILTFNYSNCPMLCSLQLNGLVDGLAGLADGGLAAPTQFRVVTVILEPKETPARAAETRASYLEKLDKKKAGLGAKAKAGGWTFLVSADGSDAAIRRLADTVGFRYHWVAERAEFAHPAVLIFLSASGSVTRYVHGIQYEPTELYRSVVRAGIDEPSAAVGFVQRCFHYDPGANSRARMGVMLMKYGAAAFVAFIAGVYLLLRFLRRQRGATSLPGVARS